MDTWKYLPASADEVDDDTSPEGQAARSDRAKIRWYEKLNDYGEEGWELVTEHVSENTDQTTYWGTLKQRHDTDDV